MTVSFEKNPSGDEVAIILNEDGSIVSMLKSTYDAMQAEQSTPIVTDETKAK